MAMSQYDDILSVDEDFEDAEQVLDPSLVSIATPVAANGRKRKTVTPGPAAAPRGRAWREKDSILLVKAFKWVEETRKGISTVSDSVLMKDNESQAIQDNNMYKHWLSLDPDETGRTSTSVIARWKDMVSMFKYFPYCIFIAYCRFIISFNDNKIVGSTGRPHWFQLLDVEQRAHIQARNKGNKKPAKVVMTTAVVELMLDPIDPGYLR
jgi:hypothetical protein